MALARPKIDHVARRDLGTVAVSTAASLQAWTVNQDGSTGAAAPLWDAEIGGTSTTSAVNPDANGAYQRWFAEPGRYKIVETIDGVVRPDHFVSAIVAPTETWIAATPLLNSWVIDGTEPPQYLKTPEGIVMLRGHTTRASTTAVTFTLPAGYRPSKVIVSSAIGTTIQVSTNGDVFPAIATGDYHWEGVVFPTS